MKFTDKDRKTYIESWLNERWFIAQMDEPPRPADIGYYHGAIRLLEMMGYEWRRNIEGKHTIY